MDNVQEPQRQIKEQYARVLEGSDQGFWDWDLVRQEFKVSPRFETMLGYEPGEMQLSPDNWAMYVHPDDLVRAWESIERNLKGQSPSHEVEIRCKTKSGGWKWILTRGRIVARDKDGNPLIMSGTHTDITERKMAEERERRLKNIYQALSEVNNAIIHQLDETELFTLVCRIAVECGGMMHAWVGIPDSAGRFIPAAQFGRLSHVPREFEISARPELPEGRGPTGMAFRENRTVIVNDAINDELLAPFQERVRQDGTGSMAVYPIERSGKPYAIVSFVSDQADAFDDEIVSLLDGMARNISFALANLDREAERKRAEDALRESEESFRQLADAMPQLVWTVTPDGHVDYSNRWYDAYSGYVRTETGTIEWLSMLHPDDVEYTFRSWQRALERGEPYQIEHRVRLADGSYRWHISRAVPVRDDEGRIVKWYGTSTDIHDLKMAQQAVQRNEERMRVAQQVTRSGAFDWDLRNNFIESSPEIEALYGLPPGQFDGKYETWLTYIHPEDRARADRQVHEAIRSGNLDASWRVLWPDGTLHWVASRGKVFKDEAGNPVRMVGINLDITENRRIEEEIKLAATVYKDSSEAMMVTDEINHIISVNQAFTDITGYEPSEVMGRNPSILRSSHHDSDFYRDMWRQIHTTGRFRGEIWNKKKNGQFFAAQLTINTIRQENGAPHRYVALMSDITEKKRSDDLIWLQANFDNLTGLPNRRFFRDKLEHEVRNSRRTNLPLALMFLDLDGFKDVNDTLGHDMGDILLKEAAERLRSSVRESDTVARLGGDEFTVILTELHDPGNVDRVALHILRSLSEPIKLGEELAYVSASIGITLFPNDATEVEDLIKNADQAMYSAKQEGKNRYHFFTQEMQDAAMKRMRIINDMRVALEDQQFEVVYQPILELSSGAIIKAEALIRWQHPTQGLINPIDFISAAEDTGMISSFGDWIFHEAARQAAIWRKKYHPDFQISVNISPVQFKNARIDPSLWFEHLKTIGLPGQGIVVEITEGLLLDATSKVTDQLLMLRDAGIEVALDDFGTGYSSLSYLKKFDIDYIKIDRAFVHNLEPGSSDMALCEAIIVMAHKLGIEVIAEGVETSQQQKLLANAGCDYAQGYLFSKPVAVSEFESLLAASRSINDPFPHRNTTNPITKP